MKDGEDRTVQHGYGDMASRARHSPLVFEVLRNGRGEGRWRDGFSSYLDKILQEHGLYEAAQRIRDGWVLTVQGLGCKTSDPLKIPGGANNSQWAEDTLVRYTTWQKTVIIKRGMPYVQVTLEILCHGQTLNETDAKRKQREGRAKEMMLDALAQFSHVKA